MASRDTLHKAPSDTQNPVLWHYVGRASRFTEAYVNVLKLTSAVSVHPESCGARSVRIIWTYLTDDGRGGRHSLWGRVLGPQRHLRTLRWSFGKQYHN